MAEKDGFISKKGIIGVNIYSFTKRVGFRLHRPKRSDRRVVFLGDSITDGLDIPKFYPTVSAVNRGISGDTTWGVLKRLGEVISLSPSLIVLLIGTNDFSHHKQPAEVEEGYRSILSRIKKELPACKVLVQSVYPTNYGTFGDLRGRNQLIKELNVRLEALATSLNYTYLDVYSVLEGEGGYCNNDYFKDGLHPNEAGYVAAAAVITPVIERLLGEKQ